MFEFRVAGSYAEVSALFGEGISLAAKGYVEDPGTGTRLTEAGGIGREESGEALLLRWRGRVIGLEARVTRGEGERDASPVATLSRLGTSSFARLGSGVAPVDLTAEEAAAAARVAAEAYLVYANHRADHGPGLGVRDPLDPSRVLVPADLGYGDPARARRDSR